MSSSTVKTPKQMSFSLEQKLEIVDRVKSGESRANIIREYKIAKSTLSDVLKRSEEVRGTVLKNPMMLKMKKIKPSRTPILENAMALWVAQQRESRTQLTGPMIKAKALEYAELLEVENFKASNGWFCGFKKRHQISGPTTSDSDSVNLNAKEDWIKMMLNPLIEVYNHEDIFNLDEFALFWRALPSQTKSLKGERCSDGKFNKERLTVLAGANMSGSEKLPLLVIGNCKKLRDFENSHILPTKFKNDATAWMNSTIFEEELLEWDDELEKVNRKVLAIIDSCSSHPKALGNKLRNIELLFLPTSTPPIMQPMQMGIVKSVKHLYRRQLVSQQIKAFDCSEDTDINIIEALNILANAWSKLTEQTISSCFNKAGWIRTVSEECEVDEDYINIDKDVATAAAPSESDALDPTEDPLEDHHKPLEASMQPSGTSPDAMKLFYSFKTSLAS